MNTGIYQGVSAMSGLEQWQSLISHNIANSGTAGYKGTQMRMENASRMGADFSTMLSESMIKADPRHDFSQGQMVPSDNPLDVAIDGAGFFEVEASDGTRLYTRDGQFHLNNEHVLVTKSNQPVRSTGGELQFLPGAGEPRIDTEGRVYQGEMLVGELAIVGFRNLNALEARPGGFAIRPGSDAGADLIENPRVLQGYYEASNTSPVTEMVNLIAVSRAYEANQKVIQTKDRMLERATSSFATQ